MCRFCWGIEPRRAELRCAWFFGVEMALVEPQFFLMAAIERCKGIFKSVGRESVPRAERWVRRFFRATPR
jgi:hypothetical protein